MPWLRKTVITTMIELDKKCYQSFPKAWATFPDNVFEYFDFSWYVDFTHWHTVDKNEQATLNFCRCKAFYWVSYCFQNI